MPTVLITGASSGIGRASALRLSRAGWKVLAGVRGQEAGEQLAAEAPAGRIEPLLLDVTSEEQIEAARGLVDAGGEGRLDALVNNAGVGAGGPLEILSSDELRSQFEVNVFGPVALTRALLPALRRARGRIVFVSSIGGKVVMPFTAPYGASKHAIEAIADSLRDRARRLARPGRARRARVGVHADLGQEPRRGRRACRSRPSSSPSTERSSRR